MSLYILEEECIAYADLILFLVSADRGDTVLIRAEFEHASLIYALTKQAYKKGVKHVQYDISNEKCTVYRAIHSEREYLSYIPKSTVDMLQECYENKSCVISIRSPEDPCVTDMAPSDAISTLHKTRKEKFAFFHKGVITDVFSWIVVAFPTVGWAKNVFPTLAPQEGVRKLWTVAQNILRLRDSESGIQAWKRQQKVLFHRGTYLQKKKYQALRFRGEGTDLTVHLHPRSVWSTGVHTAKNGKVFQANVPTEEVYTSPDCRYTHGTVRVQRPVDIFGKKVENSTFTFQDGAVVQYAASKNKEALAAFLSADTRNTYMGEIALVDTGSRVWQSGCTFASILYDENAGVHFALGTAYTSGYGFDADAIPSDEKLLSMGCNVSNFHIDFTIGYEGLSVFGIGEDGAEEPIITKGQWIAALS